MKLTDAPDEALDRAMAEKFNWKMYGYGTPCVITPKGNHECHGPPDYCNDPRETHKLKVNMAKRGIVIASHVLATEMPGMLPGVARTLSPEMGDLQYAMTESRAVVLVALAALGVTEVEG